MEPTEKIFKNSNGVYLTKELFFETAIKEDRPLTLYSLKSEDHQVDGRTFPSLRRIYLELDDLTEFLISDQYFGGHPHWKKLLSCSWFISVLKPIREELKARHMAEYLRTLRKDALSGNAASAKFLLDRLEHKGQKGRPSKEKIEQEAKKLVQDSDFVSADLERLLGGLR